jgi:hypothetical protein
MLNPPEGWTEEQTENFIASLRAEARDSVREMLAQGAPEDEVLEYIESLDSESDSSTDPP